MSIPLYDVIKITVQVVGTAYKIAVILRNSEELNAELKDTVRCVLMDLTIIEGLLDNLQTFAYRVSAQDEKFLSKSIDLLNGQITDVQNILEEVQRDRNVFRRLFMKTKEYQRKLEGYSAVLKTSCIAINGAIPAINKIEIPRREFPDFRKNFQNQPEKLLLSLGFSINENSLLSISFDASKANLCSCYIKLGNEQFFFSYQIKTWFTSNPTPIILPHLRDAFIKNRRNRDQTNSPHNESTASPLPIANNIHEKLDFSGCVVSHDDICGIALTKSYIYIATKCEITSILLRTREVVAQFGREGIGPGTFDHISYMYIPPNDQTNLYIVDRNRHAVYQYEINDTGICFNYIRRYTVIANVSQPFTLISCAIFNRHLYVSDNANNCLHMFPLNGERQSSYLTDNLITPFSPGPMCVHGKYLYVASCSAENTGILVFNEECQPVEWFRHHSLKEIIAMDIDPNINELYILTTTTNSEDNLPKKISVDCLNGSRYSYITISKKKKISLIVLFHIANYKVFFFFEKTLQTGHTNIKVFQAHFYVNYFFIVSFSIHYNKKKCFAHSN